MLNNLYFNLEKESIIPADNDNSVYLKPKLYLIYGIINNYNKPKDYKLCIVDDIYKLDQSNIVISNDNYTSIKLDQLYSNDTIGICKKFFYQMNISKCINIFIATKDQNLLLIILKRMLEILMIWIITYIILKC